MAQAVQLSSLSNPLVTVEQLSSSNSQLHGISSSLESTIRYAGAQLTQAAGVLLRLPQDIIAQAIVILTRFCIGESFKKHAAKDISAASLYLIAKISTLPQSPRSIINVYAYLLSPSSRFDLTTQDRGTKPDPGNYYVSEGTYLAQLNVLLETESLILRSLAFNIHVSLPHHLALTYLQTLGVLPHTPTAKSSALAKRTLAHLNTALLSPQLLYLTHQPPALAVAAVYLAAREIGIKLPGVEWWEVFDVDREELGFLVVGMRSVEGWVKSVKEKSAGRRLPFTTEEVEIELENEDLEREMEKEAERGREE